MTTTQSLREAVCHSANLGAAFAYYRRRRGLWSPGVPMWQVTQSPVVPMLQLAEALREGSYRPQPTHSISIAKANGEQRILSIYALRDRVAQRALLQVLQARTDASMSPYSFGFRPGRSVGGALASVRRFLNSGLDWVVDADIEHCFDSLPRGPLLAQVRRRLDDESAAEWVSQCLGWQTPEQIGAVGIPQGAALSPWLCNIYLWQLDDAMEAEGVAMVRFADDFVLLAGSRVSAESFRARCAEVVSQLLLRLHPVKTAILHATSPFRFLGQWLGSCKLRPALPAIIQSHAHVVLYS